MALTFGELFAGIGGFSLGFERAGMEARWHVEIEPYCQKVLRKHWPRCGEWDDVRTFPPHPAEDWSVDVICGGFPCQDISNAGKRAGLDGERSGLWKEFVRIIRVLRPRVVVVENVSALLVRGIDRVLGDLAESGFNAEWQCLPAGIFGAHFRRDRVFIFASRSMPSCLRREGEWSSACGAWSEQQFARLVDHQLQLCVPAGKGNRVSDGISGRMGQLKSLGNAVVPQVSEFIGRRIVEHFAAGGKR